jgi:hypothetical protein
MSEVSAWQKPPGEFVATLSDEVAKEVSFEA